MKYIFLLVCLLLSHSAGAGSLYTFNKSDIQLRAITWIKNSDSELSKVELKAKNVSPYIKKTGVVEVLVYFTYKSANKYGFNYVCVRMNEDGELLGFRRDIEVYKGNLGIYRPADPGCG